MYSVILVLILIYLLFDSRTEKFGYSGAYTPIHEVVLNDPKPKLEEYIKVENITINNDLMEDFVLLTNKYLNEQAGIHNYIIETKDVKQYKHKEKNHYLYRCNFMCVKPSGFVFGFSVTSDILVINNKPSHVLGVNSQELDINPPSDKTPFESSIEGSEYVLYEDIKNSELDTIKK
jgi:hypothetical protein|tara:strand:- start:19740 stop:20267 length:528 start_codon:yes stop_codon:yes gene_type:complete